MPKTQLDHIVIAAPSLAEGLAYVRQAFGVEPQPGGEHPRMGTHNCFLRLGDGVYLEVIAANPAAAHPNRPRWFGLDTIREPRLAAWVARTEEIHAAAAASPVSLGKVEPMSRGELSWLISIPEDGRVPLDGAAPMLIQWPAGTHPTATQPDLGCLLIGVEIFHPRPDRVQGVLRAIGFDGACVVYPGPAPSLTLRVRTRAGSRELRAP